MHYITEHFGISTAAATVHMEVQSKGWNIVAEMKRTLGSAYGGVWFNAGTGRYSVGLVDHSSSSNAAPYLSASGIAQDTDFVPVKSSMGQLEEAQSRLDATLQPLLSQGLVATGIDTENNAVLVRVSSSATAFQSETARRAANSAGLNVQVVTERPENVELHFAACQNHAGFGISQLMFCDRSLRGGVSLFDRSEGSTKVACSLGFMFRNSSGEYVMTAGHCFLNQGSNPWFSAFSNFSESNTATWAFIGNYVGHYIGENGDFGFIQVDPGEPNAGKSPWLPISNPSSVASLDPTGPWGQNEDWYLENVAWSAQHDIACRTGGSSDTQCGEVLALNESETIEGVTVNKLARANFCAIPGDSGGTVWGNHSGLGMTDAINVECNHSGAETWYTEAIWDLHYIGGEFYVPPYGEL